MPCTRFPVTLNTFPDTAGSPTSNAFIEMLRLTSFSWKTSIAALQRSSVSEVKVIASSPAQATVVLVPRKSKRLLSSLAAWLSALSTSCRSTLLTTSNDGSATTSLLNDLGVTACCDATGVPRFGASRRGYVLFCPHRYDGVGRVARAANGSGL